MRRAGAVCLILVGVAATAVGARVVAGSPSDAVMVAGILLVGPAWALSFCLVSDESDFSGASRSRAEWLAVLPWTFLLAPLVVPNVILLSSFFRDSRADGGRSPLTWDRMRPGEHQHDR